MNDIKLILMILIYLSSFPLHANAYFNTQKNVSTTAQGAYSIYSADIDNDGLLDIIAGSAHDNKVAWYKNTGNKTFSTEQVITRDAQNLRSVYAADLNNDGYIDILSASVNDNKIAWYQNNGDGTISTNQQVISNDVALAHSVYAADMDNDGDMDVLSVGYSTDAATYWHENQGNGVFAAKQVVGITGVSASVHAVDLDNDGDKDVVVASMTNNNVVWFRNERGSFSEPIMIDTSASGFISAADMDNDGDADLVLGGGNPALGTGTNLLWYKNDGTGNFTAAETMTTTANGVRAVYATDLDKDGDADVLTATAGGTIAWYENNAGVMSTSQQVISNTVTNASSVFATDLDNDGDMDVLSASIDNNSLVLHENLKPKSSHAITTAKNISNSAQGAYSVFSADLNNDGLLDIIAGSAHDNKVAWYKNTGNKTFSTEQVITTEALNLRSVYAADLNNDGHIDVLSASVNDNKIAWYQNNGDGTISTNQQIISNDVALAHAVYTADIDNDGDMDVLSVGYSTDAATYWHENQGNGVFAAKQVVGITGVSASVHAVDLDNDGDKDVVSASMTNNNVVWFRNERGSFSAPIVIDTSASGFISAADMDNDGDADLVLGGGNPALGTGTNVLWYKNDGKGNFTVAETMTTTANGVRAVYAKDMDNDGNADVLTATAGGTIAWYKNNAGVMSTKQQVISNTVTNASSVFAADLDNDGDQDVISASIDKHQIEWYENIATKDETNTPPSKTPSSDPKKNPPVENSTPGTIPLRNIKSIQNLSVVTKIASLLPIKLVSPTEENVVGADGVKRLVVTGDISFDIPGLNGSPITLHGGKLLVLAETPQGETSPTKNVVFVKYRLHDFLKKGFGISLSQDFIDNVPNVEMLLSYGKSNFDVAPINTLPQSVQTYFHNIFSAKFGIPIFNDSGNLNVFIPLGLNQFPKFVAKPLADLGITQQFVTKTLGVDGSLVASLAVSEIDNVLNMLSLFFPNANGGKLLPIGTTLQHSMQMGVILPAASLPEWITGGSGNKKSPLFTALNFQPDAAVQFRHFLTIDGGLNIKDITSSSMTFKQTLEAALKVKMPNLLNADALKNTPVKTQLDVRVTLNNSIDASSSSAEANVQGTLRLLNDWPTPFGIPGISIGKAILTVAGGAAFDATVAGAGGSVTIGYGGQFSCLDDQNKPIGTPRESANVVKLKVLVPPTLIPVIKPQYIGVYSAIPNLTLQQSLKCAVGVQTGIILGMGNSLIPLVPQESRAVVRSIINGASGDIKGYINQLIEKPLAFAPIAAVMDQVRINNGAFYVATPGATLANYIDEPGIKLSGDVEYRQDRNTQNWKTLGSLDASGTFGGILVDFGIGDLTLTPEISLLNNKFKLDLKPSLDTSLTISGQNKFLGLHSDTDVTMSLKNGVKVKYDTQINNFGGLALNLNSVSTGIKGINDLFDPKLLDFKGSGTLTYDAKYIRQEINSAVNTVRNNAQKTFDEVLSKLTGSKTEAGIKQEIKKIKEEKKIRREKIDNTQGKERDKAKKKLDEMKASIKYDEKKAKYWWKEHDSCSGTWWLVCRADKAKNAKWHEAGATAKRLLIAVGSVILKTAEQTQKIFNSAIEELGKVFDPKIIDLEAKLFTLTEGKKAQNTANTFVNNVSKEILNATNIKVHGITSTISSLQGFDKGTSPMSVSADIELPSLGIRCKNKFDVYAGRVDQLITGMSNTLGQCIINASK